MATAGQQRDAAELSELEPLLTYTEVRRLLGGIARTTLYEIIKGGDLAFIQIGGRRFVEPAALRAFLDARRRERATP